MRTITLLAALVALTGCATWQRTEIAVEAGRAFENWDRQVLGIDVMVPITDRVDVHIGHMSDPSVRDWRDPNITYISGRVMLKAGQ